MPVPVHAGSGSYRFRLPVPVPVRGLPEIIFWSSQNAGEAPPGPGDSNKKKSTTTIGNFSKVVGGWLAAAISKLSLQKWLKVSARDQNWSQDPKESDATCAGSRNASIN